MDVAAFLTHVVTEPAVLFGHSLGGTIAAMVAAQHPQSVRALMVGAVAPFAEGHASWVVAQRDVLLRLRDLASSGRPVAEIEATLKELPLPVAGQAAPVRAEDVFGPDHPWCPVMRGC
ncbi:MAG TPA: alpha/beta fold hydrolase [Chloroflexota bacterium]|nr:alpha/beta fold hydrolase [Chloroflexota bacterium]